MPNGSGTRGFNQASILAQALSKSLRLPLDEVSLVRVSATEKYRAGLDAKGRRDTVAGAFEVRHPRLVANEDILLVDDVFTTGATVSACAEALLGAGAENVFVLTIAGRQKRTRVSLRLCGKSRLTAATQRYRRDTPGGLRTYFDTLFRARVISALR